MLYFASGFWQNLIDQDDVIAFVAIVGGTVVVVTGIVFSSLKAIVISRSREATKRELAAYIAEGSLDPEKAVALANAGKGAEEA